MTEPNEHVKLYTENDIREIARTFGGLPYAGMMNVRLRDIKSPDDIIAFLTGYSRQVAVHTERHGNLEREYHTLLGDREATMRFLGIAAVLERLDEAVGRVDAVERTLHLPDPREEALAEARAYGEPGGER
jgi:hypothetical protein